MCERCERVEHFATTISLLVPLMHRDRTDEQMEEALEMFHEHGNREMTLDDLEAMSLNDLCGIIAARCAMAVQQIDEEPLSMILGGWAGSAMQAEEIHALDQVLGFFGPSQRGKAPLN